MSIKTKSKSQVFRAVLFRVWETNFLKGEFEDYYSSEMDRISEHYKKKIK